MGPTAASARWCPGLVGQGDVALHHFDDVLGLGSHGALAKLRVDLGRARARRGCGPCGGSVRVAGGMWRVLPHSIVAVEASACLSMVCRPRHGGVADNDFLGRRSSPWGVMGYDRAKAF
nr:unnamed protein product [Digitaria exilis]